LIDADVSQLPPESLISEGGKASLFDEIAVVTFSVRNNGEVAAAEVAQLYVSISKAPVRQPRGFGKKFITPGEMAEFKFVLIRDLSI
jgi:beta-glucosidase